jgi:hypothetical protein
MSSGAGRKAPPAEAKILRTNQGDVLSAEYWLVVFFDRVPGQQFKIYSRLGSLMNAVEDHFGWRWVEGRKEEDLPEFHVWHVDLIACTVKAVEGPTWR